MPLSKVEQEQRDRIFQKLLETVLPLKNGPDPEVTMEALLEAVDMLHEHLQQELAELRQEQAE